MLHKIPVINEVRLELNDIDFFIGNNLEENQVHHDWSVQLSYELPGYILFFIHIQYSLKFKEEEEEELILFHTDYLCKVQLKVIWEEGSIIKVETELLSHLLGMCILMIRGATSIRLKGNILSQYPLPVINPTELINEIAKHEGEETIIEKEWDMN